MSVIFLYPVFCCSVVAVIKKHQSYLDKRFFNRMFVVLLVCGFHNSWQVHQTASSKNNPKNVYWTRYFCENTKKKSILWTARKAGTCKKARTKKKLLRTRFCSDYWKEIHFPQKDVYLKINIISKKFKIVECYKKHTNSIAIHRLIKLCDPPIFQQCPWKQTNCRLGPKRLRRLRTKKK